MFTQVPLLVPQRGELLALLFLLFLSLFLLQVLLSLIVLLPIRLWQHYKKQENKATEKTLVLSEPVASQPGDFDRILDFALSFVTLKFHAEQPAPNVNASHSFSFAQLEFDCQLKAKHGRIEGLSSLHRVGPTETSKSDDGVLILDATLELTQLHLSFREYYAHAGFIDVAGALKVTVTPVRLRAQVALSPPFTVELRSLALAETGRMRLEPTGLGLWTALLPIAQVAISGTVQQLAVEHISEVVGERLKIFSEKMKDIQPIQLFPLNPEDEEEEDSGEDVDEDEYEEEVPDWMRNRRSPGGLLLPPWLQ